MVTTNEQTTGSSLPTTSVNMAVAGGTTSSASMQAQLFLLGVYTKAMNSYADQLVLDFDFQMDDAKHAAHETVEAAEQQMWGSILQGGAQIAQGGFAVAGGLAGTSENEEIENNIKNANKFRDATDNHPNMRLTDAQLSGCHTQEQNTQIEKMRNSQFDFGKEKFESYSDSLNHTTTRESQAIKENVDEYIKRQQAKQAQPNSKAQIYNGIGTMIAGGGHIGNGVFNLEASNHTSEAKIYEAAQSAASSMIGNAQQQWNSVVSSMNQLMQLMIQIAQSNRVNS